LGIADRLGALISDPRDPNLVTHSVADILPHSRASNPGEQPLWITQVDCWAIMAANAIRHADSASPLESYTISTHPIQRVDGSNGL
jgi:hypothetical protein